MKYGINDTSKYHREDMNSLGWELTVCNTLEGEKNPGRDVLKNKSTFGNLLYNYLSKIIPMGQVTRIIEIGGGYGYLMRDFLSRDKSISAVMLDLSSFLLEKQREILKDFPVEYINQDLFTTDAGFLSGFDLAILNENIGDFPTLFNLDPALMIEPNNSLDKNCRKAKELIEKYSLPIPSRNRFSFNLGAIEAVVMLCSAQIQYIYISEHSCETAVPYDFKENISDIPVGNPERIQLKGHDEYTVKFSHLERVAEKHSYTTIRGQYKDFIEFDYTDKLHFILMSHSHKDEHEIIRHFIEDLYKYEYLILIKDASLSFSL
jgi:hypothetical protein